MSADKLKDSADKNKPAADKSAASKSGSAKAPAPPPAPQPLPPLFRPVDWLTFGVTTLLVFIGYFLTVAPDVTLEDSGELTTGSFYAGVPHPPGYPFWSVVTYLFSNIYRVGNIAYRVAVASALAGAFASGLLGMLVSRGSSMILEGIGDFKELPRKLENWIVFVCGLSAGLMLAFNGYMWSQSVIVEVYPMSVLSLMIACTFLLRWMYAPHQKRYLFLAWYMFGIGFTNHQTLLVATMGLETAAIACQPKLGRDLLLLNSIVYIIGVFVLTSHMMGANEPGEMVQIIFHLVGVASIVGCVWLSVLTKSIGKETWTALGLFGVWILGAAFFFYMPITSMTNPPMNWGYPRTWDGFIHAFTRGQYEKITPVNFFTDPARFGTQLGLYVAWAQEEFNMVNLALAIVPIIFFFRMQKRERAWLIGLAGIWFCLAIILLILLNPNTDRASESLNKVFFASSYTAIAMYIGYGLALIAASMYTFYQRFRLWAICGGVVAATLALVTLFWSVQDYEGDTGTFFGTIAQSFAPNQYGLPIYAGLILLGLTVAYVLINLICRQKAPMWLVLIIFALLPLHSIMDHWADNEERGHWFGYWFGHDMFTPPFGVYPEMARNAVLFGGTDPGRFCPTYMIFVESMIPHDKQPAEDPKFDRRDVYIITQNALADPTYLEYIRAQYNRSTQIDTPFFQEMLRLPKEKEQNYTTNFVARLAYQLLDKPLTAWGAKVEARRRAELIYPPKEIYTPTPEDSAQCFSAYMQDAQQRVEHDMRFPNEPKLIKPGEDVHPSADGRVSVSGQVAVMSINGLLTKVIFDHNPDNEFYVEESFPLDWMYPYLSPFGVIMKINRQPLDEITADMIDKDHRFWSKYSERLVGNWITYDTPLKDVAAFVEKVDQLRNFEGFKGDPAFIRDDVAQKSFSKLRSSIGGIYDYRFHHAKTAAEQQAMLKEAEFAYKQSFAFCPYSPEAVFRYVQLLLQVGKMDDALIVAETCAKLDPNNGQVEGLLHQLRDIKGHPNGSAAQNQTTSLADLQKAYLGNTNDFQAAFNLAGAYLQLRQQDQAMGVLDQVLANPNVNAGAILFLAQAYAKFNNMPKLEVALEKLTVLQPHSPEAWCDLAAMKTALRKTPEALKDLSIAMGENAKRLANDPKASNLVPVVRADQRFLALHGLPEYEQLLATNK